jgi:hypothetical protein
LALSVFDQVVLRFAKRLSTTRALLCAGLLLSGAGSLADPVPVELRQGDDGWQLLRGGEPYLIKGAGGSASLERLAAAGANSVRTWSTEDAGRILDEAHALGMTVTVGIWLGHERHGFDYADPAQVEEQFARARDAVLRYKDHPALLLWGVGNEMEGFESGDNPAIWKAVNDIGVMIRELDPHHPTMTVTAEIGGERIEWVHRNSPAIDIHGINTYGGALSVAERLREGGATKPYVLTEFGPVGTWEMPTTDWGAPYEQTSTAKAEFYRQSYRQAVLDNPGTALGAYAFLWGHKMEGTSTWFGMLLGDGAKLGAVDAMTELWAGTLPDDTSPTIEPIQINTSPAVEPGTMLEASAAVGDAEGQDVRVEWVLRPESGEYSTGGDFRRSPPDVDGAVIAAQAGTAKIRMPDEPGPYRLFAYAYDPAGNAATANIPLLVKGEPRTRMPVAVYEEGFEAMPWVPSGWMGGVDELTLDGDSTESVHEGSASIRMRYTGTYGWVGVAWQHPPNNWGEQDGGFDLTGASVLEVWARGEYGGEKVTFGVGLLGKDREYPDSAMVKTDTVVLESEWQKYRVPLEGKDLSSLKTGFVVTLQGRRSPVTVYLDSIRFVR